jgi:hypothetical protein
MTHVMMRIAYRILVAKPQGRRLFWLPRRRWEDNTELIRIELLQCCPLNETGRDGAA